MIVRPAHAQDQGPYQGVLLARRSRPRASVGLEHHLRRRYEW